MRLPRSLIVILVCFAVLPAVTAAQQPAPAGKVAGIAPPPAPATPPPVHARARRGPVFFGNLPVVILSDGRVFADFGRGFEQVVHSCGVPASFDGQTAQALVQPTVIQPTVIQPSAGLNQPVPYTPPVPSQPTTSQQTVSQATQQAQASRSTLVNTQMCWSNDPRGRVFVGLP